MDRRADPRVDVKLPCHVAAAKSKSCLFVGVTENISRGGMLVSWVGDSVPMGLPRPGDLLTVVIELPVNHSFGQRCMHCQAVVARVITTEKGARFALQVNQMQFRDYPNGNCGASAGRDSVGCSVM